MSTDAHEPILYLASPYSHPERAERERRYHQVCMLAANLIGCGLVVYSPIAHSHGIAQYSLGNGWEQWKRVDLAMLARCEGLAVAQLDGWSDSVGVREEIAVAHRSGVPVVYLADWIQIDRTLAKRMRADMLAARARRVSP